MLSQRRRGKLRDMNRPLTPSGKLSFLCGLLFLLDAPRLLLAQPSPAAVTAFNAYAASVQMRISEQHRSDTTFLARPDAAANLHAGDFLIERVPGAPPGLAFPGALLHHWRGTAFAPGARAADFEHLIRNFGAYPQHFAPEVLQAAVLTGSGKRVQASMRVRQHHVITVVMDSAYDVSFGQLDAQHGYSISQSTRIAEVDAAGTPAEHTLSPAEEHGFLWRLNTFWSYQERDDGLLLQIEAVSLSRSVPRGLAWAIKPYVESIPRESLEFTLRSACNAIRK